MTGVRLRAEDGAATAVDSRFVEITDVDGNIALLIYCDGHGLHTSGPGTDCARRYSALYDVKFSRLINLPTAA